MHTITPFLWFDNNGEEAMNFYIDLFKKMGGSGETLSLTKVETFVTGEFKLNNQKYMFINAGPQFKFTEAISFFVEVDTQEEVDGYWEALTADGGEEQPCGWLKDKFGLSWQIIPKALGKLMSDSDHEAAGRATQAMLKMKKIVISDLEKAFKGK